MAVITLLVLLFPRQSSMSADDDKEFGSSMLPWGRLNRGLLNDLEERLLRSESWRECFEGVLREI